MAGKHVNEDRPLIYVHIPATPSCFIREGWLEWDWRISRWINIPA